MPDVVTGHIMMNGLYSIHVSLQDGRTGKGSGVVMFLDGKIVGGDAYLYYTGSYTTKGDTFKGEVLVQRHTSSPDANPLFGGPSPVGIGVSGTFTETAAVMNGTALVGKASQIFTATLRKLASFETRHTLSSVDRPGRGIGAARQWILDELTRSSPRLKVAFDTYDVPAQGDRITRDATQRSEQTSGDATNSFDWLRAKRRSARWVASPAVSVLTCVLVLS